jgi:hypothetical protein
VQRAVNKAYMATPLSPMKGIVPAQALRVFNGAVSAAKKKQNDIEARSKQRLTGCSCLTPCASLKTCLTPQILNGKRAKPNPH